MCLVLYNFVYLGMWWLKEVSLWLHKKKKTLHSCSTAQNKWPPTTASNPDKLWLAKRPGEEDTWNTMQKCRGGLKDVEEGPRHSRAWEDERRGIRRGKRKKTDDVQPLGHRRHNTIHGQAYRPNMTAV